ncbi:MAG: hypothetical protein MRZ39_06390 [Oscillospiraceae bacterium]|nr:hypothetical protein [Oscillospiraceae bacterium]
MDINFHIPDFINHCRLNLLLLTLMQQHPEYFRDGVKIASVFGAFPPSLWNGGRNTVGVVDDEIIRQVTKAFNSRGVPLRFTFTNPLIEEKHLGDPFCNKVMRMCDNGLNEVIVLSPILEEYIRKNYPSYKITSSTCKEIRNADELSAELEKDYHYVVLDYNWNNNFEFLETLPHKEKCELLINACCVPNCPRRGEHYRSIGETQIKYAEYMKTPPMMRKPTHFEDFKCPSMLRHIYQITDLPTHISPDAIIEKYVPMGFSQFKIEGRTVPDIALAENYIYYMIKPEYKDTARLELLGTLTQKTKYFN